MSNPIAQLEETINALEAALGSGVLTVTVDGETTTFDSEAGLRRRLRYFNDELSRLRSQRLQKPFKGDIAIRGGNYRTVPRSGGCGT